MPEYTNIQTKMLAILSDGMPHTREELHACCGPSSLSNVRCHLVAIRKLLRPIGQDILCTLVNRRICYRHIRLLASANNGKR